MRGVKIKLDKRWLIEEYSVKHRTLDSIATEKECSAFVIRNNLIRMGIPIRDKGELNVLRNPSSVLRYDDTKKFIIDGCLLGDASICRTTKDGVKVGNPYFFKGNINRDHVEHVSAALFGDAYTGHIYGPYKRKDDGLHDMFFIRSMNQKDLFPVYYNWYTEVDHGKNIKRIPEDVSVNEETLLHWFMDDGYSLNHFRRYSGQEQYNHNEVTVWFATHCFSKEELEMLSEIIKDNLGIELRVYGKKHNAKMYYQMRVVKKYVSLFFEIIGSCPVDSMSHKWKKLHDMGYDVRWDNMFDNLQTFINEHSRYPRLVNSRHNPPADEIKLGKWVATQRSSKRGQINIDMTDKRRLKLESLPGWKWSGRFPKVTSTI